MSAIFEIRATGFQEALQRLRAVPQLVRVNAEAAVAATVMQGARWIMEDTPVDTGRLRASIGGNLVPSTEGRGGAAEGRGQSATELRGLTGVIGTNVEYAVHVEYGHVARGPRQLTARQRAYLFAVGILVRGPGGRVLLGDINRRINRRAGITFRVKGKGMFRKNIPRIREYFLGRMNRAVAAAAAGQTLGLEG